ncbi:MAG: aminotransferase class I/II-fold pyridoxal phosphate-dependent enzyme [Bacteroidales bacterium]|nr:aminotransferase class I/II-fold pyridoxal phosphate-dependent enzyme [Bacteroidales bacterium]
MTDIFDKLRDKKSALGQYRSVAHGYISFPKLEGPIGPMMTFRGKEVLTWSINSYLGLANHPEVRKADADAAKEWGLAYPMGARMMSGQTKYHEQLEQELADFVCKEKAYLLNYGYQGMVSIIQSLVDRNDVIVYDSESHACILDGCQLHFGKRFVFEHNNMESLKKQLEHAKKVAEKTNGGILVITEGVFGMAGDLGKLDEIVALKKDYSFRLLIDDAHGFGTMGEKGAGTGEHFKVQDGIDVYFSTFAKSMALIGAFVAAEKKIIDYLQYVMRSQVFAKSLPMPMVIGALKRLDMLRSDPSHKANLWKVVNALQSGLTKMGLDIGETNSSVTPVYIKGPAELAGNMLIEIREFHKIFCSVVVYPVVPKDVVMFRLIPTAVHNLEHVERTIAAFKDLKDKLEAGYFNKPIEEFIAKYNVKIEDF